MTAVMATFYVGAALSLVGVASLLSSLLFSAPGVRRPWNQFWAPADSFVGTGRVLNRAGFALAVVGSVIVMVALAWHRYFPY